MTGEPATDGFPETAEARGIALVSQGLALALLTRLRAKGLLTNADAEAIFEGCLTSLENAQLDSPDDESIKAARVILDGVAKIALRPG